jgi:hypothetical protein
MTCECPQISPIIVLVVIIAAWAMVWLVKGLVHVEMEVQADTQAGGIICSTHGIGNCLEVNEFPTTEPLTAYRCTIMRSNIRECVFIWRRGEVNLTR